MWASTGEYLYPWGGGTGYANWAPQLGSASPDDDDCVIISSDNADGWYSVNCSLLHKAICEFHPDNGTQQTTSQSSSSSSSSTTLLPNFSCPEDNGFFPLDPTVCSSKYYSCVNGIAFIQVRFISYYLK